jgi:hypothetical protein
MCDGFRFRIRSKVTAVEQLASSHAQTFSQIPYPPGTYLCGHLAVIGQSGWTPFPDPSTVRGKLVRKELKIFVTGTTSKFGYSFSDANICCSVQASCVSRPEERVPRGRTQSHRHTM